MRAADGSGDTLGLQEKAPSRGMRYIVKISQINFMLPQETHHHLLVRIHFETRTRREKKTQTHPWVYGSRVGAWLSHFSVLQYATADGCGGQSPGNRRRSSGHGNMHAWYQVHTIQISSSTTKRPCSSPPKFLVTYEADNNKPSVYTCLLYTSDAADE